jgi:hypothetical protein
MVDSRILRMIRAFLALLKLNPRLMENPYWFLPVVGDGHSDSVQVGRNPSVVRQYCGVLKNWRVCREKDLHKGIVYKGVDFTDKSAVSVAHIWCKNWHCPKCFLYGACVTCARRIEARLSAFVEHSFGKIEHAVFSAPKTLQDLSMDALFKLATAVARDRGISGVLIFHGRFIDVEGGGLGWRAHFHLLGFVEGGFDRCRNCEHNRNDCASCDGLKGREVRGFAKDNWIVKVADERKTVFGTAWYQLNHHTVRIGMRRVHSVRWIGKCGNRMLRHPYHKPSAGCRCPVCESAGHESLMEDGGYSGKRLPVDVCDPRYKRVYAVPDFDEDGSPNFPNYI